MKLNENEAPEGFIAVLKDDVKRGTENICHFCDARSLCQENKDDWCLKNRCMEVGVIAFKDGKIYSRVDGCSVVFKKK